VAYLVKPLDIGQILPTVAAAFANLPHRRAEAQAGAMVSTVATVPASAAAATLVAPPLSAATQPASPAPAGEAARSATPLDPVPLAVGVLMHRYSLQRAQALQRLHRLAAEEKRSLAEQAERLVDAVELLARGQD
jgi:response regulator NasT